MPTFWIWPVTCVEVEFVTNGFISFSLELFRLWYSYSLSFNFIILISRISLWLGDLLLVQHSTRYSYALDTFHSKRDAGAGGRWRFQCVTRHCCDPWGQWGTAESLVSSVVFFVVKNAGRLMPLPVFQLYLVHDCVEIPVEASRNTLHPSRRNGFLLFCSVFEIWSQHVAQTGLIEGPCTSVSWMLG